MGDNPKKFIGREGGVFVYILHFIILNNLYSERVLLVLFGSRGQIPLLRDQMTVKKATTGACQYSIDPFSARNRNFNESQLPPNI